MDGGWGPGLSRRRDTSLGEGELDKSTQELLTLLLSSVAIVVSLVSFANSWRSLRRASYRTAADHVLAADQITIDHPELRPYLYGEEKGRPVPVTAEPEDRWRIEAAAEFFLDVFETIWDHRAEFSRRDRASWREWIHAMMEGSPTMRELYLEDDLHWYPTLAGMFADEECTMPKEHSWASTHEGRTQLSAFTRRWRGIRRWFREAAGRIRGASRSAGEPSRS